jgi:1,4-alpha-glucan branching enzyme
LREYPTYQVATPCLSSWGEKGYGEYWCNGTNAWAYRHLHKMAERMAELARLFPSPTAIQRRALNQAARELMLAQASDWAFIMRTGTTVQYATKRTVDHVTRFTRLYESLNGSTLDERLLVELERRDNLFPEIDYRVYAS